MNKLDAVIAAVVVVVLLHTGGQWSYFIAGMVFLALVDDFFDWYVPWNIKRRVNR